jgi:hypothetical protein
MLLGLQIRNDDPASALAAWDSDGDVGKGGRRGRLWAALLSGVMTKVGFYGVHQYRVRSGTPA